LEKQAILTTKNHDNLDFSKGLKIQFLSPFL
jgi:hypothetical protein